MHLVQILLPVSDNDGRDYPADILEGITGELMARFGGVTSFMRSPAAGRWKPEGRRTHYDDIIVLEVMTAEFDRAWWKALRARLEEMLRQKEVVIRVQAIERV